MPTSEITKMEIAVFALYHLGGVDRKVHLERIAYKCYEVARGEFAWELDEFKEFPDLKAVYYALDEACKKRRGELIKRDDGTRGKGGKKFRITSSGVEWVKANEKRIAAALRLETDAARQKVEVVLKRIKGDTAFQKFRQDGAEALSVYDLADFLGASFETSGTALRAKFREMNARAELVDDTDITAFLRACESKFPNLLRP